MWTNTRTRGRSEPNWFVGIECRLSFSRRYALSKCTNLWRLEREHSADKFNEFWDLHEENDIINLRCESTTVSIVCLQYETGSRWYLHLSRRIAANIVFWGFSIINCIVRAENVLSKNTFTVLCCAPLQRGDVDFRCLTAYCESKIHFPKCWPKAKMSALISTSAT